MGILFLIIIALLSISSIFLFLLQPNETIYAANGPKISIRSVGFGICLSVSTDVVVFRTFVLPDMKEDPLYGLVLFIVFWAIVLITILLNLILKILYDRLLFPALRQADNHRPIHRTIFWIKGLLFGVVIILGLLIWRKQADNEHQQTIFQEQRQRDDLQTLEAVLDVSLHQGVHVLSTDFRHGYDGYALSIEVEGTEQWFQVLSRIHPGKNQMEQWSFNEEYGRQGFLRGSCAQNQKRAIGYTCSFELFEHQSR